MKQVRFGAQVEVLEEPRVHRRFWSAIRRAKNSAKLLFCTPEPPPDPFLLVVPPGLGFNVTSSGAFVVGHVNGLITHFSRYDKP